MNKIKIGIVTALAAVALGACGQAQTAGNRPATANTTADAPAPAPPSSWSSTGDSPETSESPASSPDAKPMTKQSSTKEAAVKGCIDAFAKKLDVRPDTLTFKPVKVGKSVAAGGPHYYTVVGWLSSPELSGGRWSICDGIKIVKGEVVPEKYPPIVSIGS